jgi:NAD(P)-dependent dehydrogenase (short-subunit alcohol dehydrogenase family)
MNKRLLGRSALVVGAGQTPGAATGNGRATALEMSKEGASIIAADRNLESAKETAQLIARLGGNAIACELDVTDEDSIAEAVRLSLETYGRIDVLHNNVGVGVLAGDAPLLDTTPEGFNRVMSINLQGMVLTCKHVVPVMRKQESGAITNIASNAALITYPYIAYQTSKAGVISLTQHLAIHNAPHGIRANVIIPGLMQTPMAIEHKLSNTLSREELLRQRDEKVPLKGGAGDCWDIAKAAVFLASPDAKFITGASLVIDGGQSLAIG